MKKNRKKIVRGRKPDKKNEFSNSDFFFKENENAKKGKALLWGLPKWYAYLLMGASLLEALQGCHDHTSGFIDFIESALLAFPMMVILSLIVLRIIRFFRKVAS